MNELRDEKYRYWLTYLLDDLPVGAKFKPELLHLTFVTWFVTDMPEEELIKSFYEHFSGRESFDVSVGSDIHLGPHEEISVIPVEPIPEVLELHAAGLNWFEEIGGRWAVKHPYAGDEFIPHIRRRSTTDLKNGDTLHVGSLTLVKALRRPDDERIVAAKVLLGG